MSEQFAIYPKIKICYYLTQMSVIGAFLRSLGETTWKKRQRKSLKTGCLGTDF